MRFRPTPVIAGFANRPIFSQSAGRLPCCWELEWRGGRVREVVEWLREHRPHDTTRVTAIIRTPHATWIVDVCEENVRITHFRDYNGWMSERMKLWWRERKERKLGEAVV